LVVPVVHKFSVTGIAAPLGQNFGFGGGGGRSNP
jgi:hypothetical protein